MVNDLKNDFVNPEVFTETTIQETLFGRSIEHRVPSYLFMDIQEIARHESDMPPESRRWFLGQLALDHLVSLLFSCDASDSDYLSFHDRYIKLCTLFFREILAGACDRAFSHCSLQLSGLVEQHFDRYFKNMPLALQWVTPKIIYLPGVGSVSGSGVKNIKIPIISYFSAMQSSSKASGSAHYLVRVDLAKRPFFASTFTDDYVKNAMIALQSQIDNSRRDGQVARLGATLLLSGCPSAALMAWLGFVKQDKKSPAGTICADIDIVYAVDFDVNTVFLPMKLGRLSHRLPCMELNRHASDLMERLFQAHHTKGVDFALENVLTAAVKQYDHAAHASSFAVCFWAAFDRACTQSVQSEYPTSASDFQAKRNDYIHDYNKIFALASCEADAIRGDELKCYHRDNTGDKKFIDGKKIALGKKFSSEQSFVDYVDQMLEKIQEAASSQCDLSCARLSWAAIDYDLFEGKSYHYNQFRRLDSLTEADLDAYNQGARLCRYDAHIKQMKFHEFSNIVRRCSDEVHLHLAVTNNNKHGKLLALLIRYYLFNVCLIYSQFEFKENISTEISHLVERVFMASGLDRADLLDHLCGFINDIKLSRKRTTVRVANEKKPESDIHALLDELFHQNIQDCNQQVFNKDTFLKVAEQMRDHFKENKNRVSSIALRSMAETRGASVYITDLYQRLLDVSLFTDTGPSLRMLGPQSQGFDWMGSSLTAAEQQQFSSLIDQLSVNSVSSYASLYYFHVTWQYENTVKCIYVVLNDDSVRIDFELSGSGERCTHSELAHGQPVRTAGEMIFVKLNNQWLLEKVNNGSGHYKPCPSSIGVMASLIAKRLHRSIDASKTRYCNVLGEYAPVYFSGHTHQGLLDKNAGVADEKDDDSASCLSIGLFAQSESSPGALSPSV